MSLIPLVAERIKALRTTANLTQEELAQIAGFSLKFYQQLESGRKKQMWLETVERLAAAFNLTVAELVGAEMPRANIIPKATSSAIHYRRRKGAHEQKGPAADPAGNIDKE